MAATEPKKLYDKEYYLKNKERLKVRMAELYRNNPEPARGRAREYYEKNKESIKAYKRNQRKNGLAWSQRNPEKVRANNQLRWRKRRAQAFKTLGGELCVKCGFKDWRALQIDHIHGGGMKHIRSFTAIEKYYQYVMEHTKEFQVLCANCNRIKVHENDETRKKVSPTTSV